MIDITLRSGRYTRRRLEDKLEGFFEDPDDIPLFIEALVKTGQITKYNKEFILSETDSQKYSYPRYYNLGTYKYGGGDRVGIRGGKDWIDTLGFPTEMILSKALVDGEWVNIREKPLLPLVKGRSPETIEAWRAQIPKEIQRKYNIDGNTPIRVRVDTVTYQYLTNLELWGYQYRVMLSYGETKNSTNIRYLEIDGSDFVNRVGKDIKKSIERDQKQIKNTILKLLSDADSEYYGLYEETEDAGNVGENIQAVPLAEETTLSAIVELRDLKNGRKIIEWNAVEKSRIPKTTDFKATINIDAGLAMMRGQTSLGLKWKNKGGFS